MRRYLIRRKSIFCGEFGFKRNFAPSKKRKISKRKRGKKRKFFFRTFPTAFAVRPGTPRNTVSWSLFWSTRPVGRYYRRRRPRSKGLPWRSVLRRRQRQRRSGGCQRRKLIRKSAGKKRLFQKGNNNNKKLFKKKTSRVAVINARTKQRSASKTLRSARKLCKYLVFVHPLINARSKSLSLSLFAFRI